jgi:glucokinase
MAPRPRSVYVGIDLGGSKILAAAVTPRGRIISRAMRPTPFRSGGRALLESISESVREAVRDAGKPRIRAIGMGSPGPLDPEKGIILRTPHIDVSRLPVGPWLSRRFGAPVILDNDVHMGLYGEFRAGAGRGHRNLVGIWVGTGVGGAVILGGRLLHGSNRNAGELGHMVLDASIARAGKPAGTLEGEAAKTGMARRLREGLRQGRRTRLASALRAGGRRLDSRELETAVKGGDPLARAVARRSARFVGIAIANLFDALSPELFVLGGGVVEALGRDYLREVRETARAFVFSTELAPVRIVKAALGDDAGILGAALAARRAHPR